MVTDLETPLRAPLAGRDLALRAARVRLLITDVDGVLTDGGVFYSERGEALKRFSLRDGMGVERLQGEGIETAFLTRENSAIVRARAEKLKLRRCHLGVTDKQAFLPELLAEAALEIGEVAYIGDDVNDAGIMAAVAEHGLVGAPLDAMPSVLRLAHHRSMRPGGYGAFRDFAEWILDLRAEARRPTAVDANDNIEQGAR